MTNGHLDIIGRAAGGFDRWWSAVLENPSKAPLFALEERVAMLKEALPTWRTSRWPFSGLLVDFAKRAGGGVDREGPAGGVATTSTRSRWRR